MGQNQTTKKKRSILTEGDVALDVVGLLLGIWVVPGSVLKLSLCLLVSPFVSAET